MARPISPGIASRTRRLVIVRSILVVLAPICVIVAFIETFLRETRVAFWLAGNSVLREADAIKRSWRDGEFKED